MMSLGAEPNHHHEPAVFGAPVSASVMGRWVSSPRVIVATAGFMLPSWSAWGPPHHAIRKGSASQSRVAWFSQRARQLPDHRLYRSRVPATGPGWRRTVGP